MSNNFLENNLKTWITKEVIGDQRVFKIIDGETFPMDDAHVFYTGKIKDLGYTEKGIEAMAKEANKFVCEWYAKNQSVVYNFYENQ